MSDLAPAFRPPWAVLCWITDTDIFVELPGKPYPYIQRFPITEAGFSKALNVLRARSRPEIRRYASTKTEIMDRMVAANRVQSSPARTEPAKFTEDQRTATRAILKRMGIV